MSPIRTSLVLSVLLLLVATSSSPGQTPARPRILITPTLGHSTVSDIAFSPDGNVIATAGTEGAVKVWSTATGRELRTLPGFIEATTLAFSPDGKTIVAAGHGKSHFWEVESGKLVATTPDHGYLVSQVAVASDSTTLAQLLDGSPQGNIRLYDLKSGRPIRSITSKLLSSDPNIGAHHPQAISLSRDGRYLASAVRNQLQIWEARSGQMTRAIQVHGDKDRSVLDVIFSPNGKNIASFGADGYLRLWDVSTGTPRLAADLSPITSLIRPRMQFSSDGERIALSIRENEITVLDAATAHAQATISGSKPFALSSDLGLIADAYVVVRIREVVTGRMLPGAGGSGNSARAVVVSSDGQLIATVGNGNVMLWDWGNGRPLRNFSHRFERGVTGVTGSGISAVALSPNGQFIVGGHERGVIPIWELASGRLIRVLDGQAEHIRAVAVSPDSKMIASGGDGKMLRLWEAQSGRALGAINTQNAIDSVVFSPKGDSVLSVHNDIALWDLKTGKLIRRFQPKLPGHAVAFSPDARLIVSGGTSGADSFADDRTPDKTGLEVFEVTSGRSVRTLAGHGLSTQAVAFSPDGKLIVSGGRDGQLKVWDSSSGRLVRSATGHSAPVNGVAFRPSGEMLVSVADDTTMRRWTADGRLVSTSVQEFPRIDQWLTVTAEGFFDGLRSTSDRLSASMGLQSVVMEQLFQSLYSPDLVREALGGDPKKQVAAAAKVMDLEQVINSGPAPQVFIAAPSTGGQATRDVVTVVTTVKDQGKGVGRIEWRVNGVTVAVVAGPSNRGPTYTVSQELALDVGENVIEVVAYNASNLLASSPSRITVNFVGAGDAVNPKLHVLAIGINTYVDQGWTPPGGTEVVKFLPLKLATRDATSVADALKTAGARQYADVKVTMALDKDATILGLNKIIDRMASEIHRRDTFVLFAAAHGVSQGGRFYLIPQDFNGGTEEKALQSRAIDQSLLQDWVVNRIKARKALILLDTCESGALVAGYNRSRIDSSASDASVGRLHEATGRPVLTAAAEGGSAFEGYEKHGVFTWTLLDALRNADRNGNGAIELSELVSHVQDQVPKIAARLKGRGRAALAAPRTQDDLQSARFGSRGEDFVLVRRLQ